MQLCTHCHSVIHIDYFDSCLKCGAINYPENFKPYDNVSMLDILSDGIKPRKSYPSSKIRGICRNCERNNMAIVNDDLCSSCYAQVRRKVEQQYAIRSPRYEAKLIEYREKKWPEKFKRVA